VYAKRATEGTVKFKIGDQVKPADIRPDSIPAYKNLRGRVVEVNAHGWVRVHWTIDASPDLGWRQPAQLTHA